MSHRAGTPDLYVMDTLANDIENLESILRMLNSDTVVGWHNEWGRAFRRDEVVEALTRLIRADLVQVLDYAPGGKELQSLPRTALPPGSYDDVYFMLTARGRIVHQNWEPELEGPDD